MESSKKTKNAMMEMKSRITNVQMPAHCQLAVMAFLIRTKNNVMTEIK